MQTIMRTHKHVSYRAKCLIARHF
ncbi:hypothetical protein BCEN4_370141 [Burkholderia cenocepacia]|nr:hypothetical protein BCEN4_370141 [Burkholderia cenocepacia]